METIHFKTVDPVSQDLLRRASQRGLGLNWERYEKQQPQDGFLRLGLSCPYGCMQGPCRIDPYGRGADRGICGLDRDGMAAAFLLRLTLQGILETIQAHRAGNCQGEIAWPAPLDKHAAAALAAVGGGPVSTGEILASAALLARPSANAEELVRQAVRLGILGIGIAEEARIAEQSAGSRGCRAGYGLLAGEAVTIGLAGRVPAAQVEALLKAGGKKPEVRLVSLGDWLPAGEAFLPIVCTSGEAETVLSSGKINLLLAGPQCDPGIPALCAQMNVPVCRSTDNPAAAAVLKQARAAFDRRVPCSFSPDQVLIGEARVSMGEREIQAAMKDGSSTKIALLGGADTLLQSLGHLPVELTKALRGESIAVASWGDAALWMLKQDLPVGILEAEEGPLSAVRALAAVGKLSDIQGICFTGLRNCREFTRALGLAALGLKVSLAVPVPVWGSEKVRMALRENLAAAGGILALFDHPAQGDELLEWFLRA
jgi:carbon-monoxide dehydrogenase catalytic subunit